MIHRPASCTSPRGTSPERGAGTHPAGMLLPQTSSASLVSQPQATTSRRCPWTTAGILRGQRTQRGHPLPCPQPAWAPAQTPSLVVPCTCNNRSLFLKQWCRTRASSYGNKASSGFGERALVLFVAGANHTGLHSISVEAPERRQSIEP